MTRNLSKFLNADQMEYLQLVDPSKNSREWSEDTIKKAFQMRLMVRSQGYEFLRKEMHWPLSSFRTLRRRLDVLQFAPGNQAEIIMLLPVKAVNPEDTTSDLCVTPFDAMKIGEAVTYDKSLKHCVSLVTPCVAGDEAGEETLATHVLAVVLKELTGHWKQKISYVFITQKTSAQMIWEYLKSVMISVHENSLKVVMLSSDIGGNNVAIVNLIGVYSTKDGVNTNVPHPVPGDADLIWATDVPHGLKNFWTHITRAHMTIPEALRDKFRLPSVVVSVSHVVELLRLQENAGPKLVPGLTASHVIPAQFEKMGVGLATTFFSEEMP